MQLKLLGVVISVEIRVRSNELDFCSAGFISLVEWYSLRETKNKIKAAGTTDLLRMIISSSFLYNYPGIIIVRIY